MDSKWDRVGLRRGEKKVGRRENIVFVKSFGAHFLLRVVWGLWASSWKALWGVETYCKYYWIVYSEQET